MTNPRIPELFDLSGKAALVTGGAVGIGLGIVRRLAEAGAAVMISDIQVAEANQAAEGLRSQGGEAQAVRTDVRNVNDIAQAVRHTVEVFGRLDIVVNNAGIFPFSPMLQTSEELWDRVLEINLKGAFFMAQQAAARMIEQGDGGAIINVASIDAYHPTGNLVHYDSSKGAMLMMTRSLALELGRHQIRVNGIAPGGIQTPGAAAGAQETYSAYQMTPEQIEQMSATFTARIPLGRAGTPDDIATVALFLASPASAYITGETIIVDGGYLLS